MEFAIFSKVSLSTILGWVSGLVSLSIASSPRMEVYKERNVIDQGNYGYPQSFPKEMLYNH